MTSYRELEIFHDSKQLAIRTHEMTLILPKFETYEEGSQLRRSSKAITTNIVEGFARRRYKADFIKYLVYAIAECDETLIHIDFIFETKSLKDAGKYQQLHHEYEILSKKINNYTKWVIRNYNPLTG